MASSASLWSCCCTDGLLLRLAAAARSFALAGAKDAPEIHDGLDEILATIRRVADDIYYRVRSIRDAIVFTLETAAIGTWSTRPSTWFARRRRHTCPRRSRPTWACRGRMPSGAHRRRRTPHDILLDQLYLMDLKVRQVAEDVVKNGSQRLVTHGRFLADRYSSSELKVQDSAATAATAPQLVHHVGVVAGRGVLQDQLVAAIG